jgi:hypothetical protein
MKANFWALIFCLFFAGTTKAQQPAFQKATNSLATNQSGEIAQLRAKAEKGDPVAQCLLALSYQLGQGVPKDYAEAVKWYRKASEKGDQRAQRYLGRCYDLGQGVPQDYTEAAKWFRKAAEQGDAEGQISLASSYYFGEGVPQDYSEAAKWFRKAAEQGDGFGQYMLGSMYHFGQGVPEAYVEAYKWYNLAAAQNETNAIKNRDTISHSMTPSQIAEGQRQASAFVAKNEGTEPGSEDALPKPEIVEGKVSAGTGFFVTDDGYLVTCEHVVHGAVSFHVKTASGSIRATLVTNDAGLDIALLKVSGSYRALPLETEAHVKLGDSVFTIGFPNTDLQGVAPKLTKGEISSLAGIRDNPRYFQISVPVQPGNSGGALVDERGNVVGIVASRLNDVATYEASGALPQNVNYAVKGGLVYNFLSRVPELSGKLKAPRTVKDQDAANAAAERAAVLVIAE